MEPRGPGRPALPKDQQQQVRHVKLPPKLDDALRQLAMRRKLSVNALLRRIIEQALQEEAVSRIGMIASDRDRMDRMETAMSHQPIYHEHRYRGGPPRGRLKSMQLAQEARARKADIDWDMVDLREVYSHGRGLCGICGCPVQPEDFTIDHIRPISRGGPHLFPNLQLAHRACNSSKGNR